MGAPDIFPRIKQTSWSSICLIRVNIYFFFFCLFCKVFSRIFFFGILRKKRNIELNCRRSAEIITTMFLWEITRLDSTCEELCLVIRNTKKKVIAKKKSYFISMSANSRLGEQISPRCHILHKIYFPISFRFSRHTFFFCFSFFGKLLDRQNNYNCYHSWLWTMN